MMERKCKDCKWWDRMWDDGYEDGICRRMPPVIVPVLHPDMHPDDFGDYFYSGKHPQTDAGDWCGEFIFEKRG